MEQEKQTKTKSKWTIAYDKDNKPYPIKTKEFERKLALEAKAQALEAKANRAKKKAKAGHKDFIHTFIGVSLSICTILIILLLLALVGLQVRGKDGNLLPLIISLSTVVGVLLTSKVGLVGFLSWIRHKSEDEKKTVETQSENIEIIEKQIQ